LFHMFDFDKWKNQTCNQLFISFKNLIKKPTINIEEIINNNNNNNNKR
jgi:hypothetical protein